MQTPFTRAAPALLALSALSAALPAHASGDDAGWKLGGAIRARYDYTSQASTLQFDTAWVSLNYDSSTWYGASQYRFYQYYGHLGDVNYLTFGYAGYKIDERQRVSAGVQQVPFGLLPYFGTTFYETIGNPLGLEDVHDLGFKYQYEGERWNFQAGFFPRDGGSWTGHSVDSARYSVNVVKADGPDGVDNAERDLLVGRLTYKFQSDAGISSEVGVSALGSRIHNDDDGRNGSRTAVAVHCVGALGPWGTQLQAARLDIRPKNPGGDDDIVTLGAFDGSFNAATKGTLYVGELNYQLGRPIGQLEKIKLYANYSLYDKSQSGFKDSSRVVLGSSFNFMKLYVATELLVGRNDPYIGHDYDDALAQGSGTNHWTKHFYTNIGYYF